MDLTLVVPLAVAAVGIVGTLSGAWVTQRRADKREAITWEREQQRERERWVREDAARTFEQRRSAYEAIHASLRAFGTQVNGIAIGRPDGQDLADLSGFTASIEASDAVSIYGSPTVVDLTNKAIAACISYRVQAVWRGEGSTTVDMPGLASGSIELSKDRLDAARAGFEAALRCLRDAIREELGVPANKLQRHVP